MTATALNFSNTTPAAPSGQQNVGWQNDGGSPTVNESAYMPNATDTATGAVQLPAGVSSPVLAPSATTDTTDAANLSSGTLPAARLPNPSASTLGGVQSIAPVSHEYLTAISTSGVPSLARPASADLSDLGAANGAAQLGASGTLPPAQLPNPSASTLGGVQSIAPVSHEYLTAISTSGVPSLARPASADLSDLGAANGAAQLSASGYLLAAEMPAITGDVTIGAGTVAATVTALNGTNLAGLATGLVKNTTATGVPSIAVAGTDYAGLASVNNFSAAQSLVNATPATSTTPSPAPAFSLSGQYWNGSASATDKWSLTQTLAAGANGTSILTLAHSGSTVAALSCNVQSSFLVEATFAAGVRVNQTGTATSVANYPSGFYTLNSSIWNGSAAVFDYWNITNVPGTGANPASTLTFAHLTGGSTGPAAVALPHLAGSTGIPTIAAGTGAGTSPTVSMQAGSTDLSGWINVTTGSAPAGSNATVATITFNQPYGAATKVILTPANAAAAALSGSSGNQVFVPIPGGGTTFVLESGATALAASTAYVWTYHVTQ